ncbi:MAG: helix-turn-helix transcriptional regulator [Clostridia bacterium]|nr:helix-turn-helix transcriptional regulator [Clostridia bacterium]
MNEVKNLGERIKALRLLMNETQEEFAEHCDISSETVSLLERGRFSPRLETLKRITEYTHLTISALFNDYLYIAEQNDNESYITYGIKVFENNKLIKSVPDVFTDETKAVRFVNTCNRIQLSPVHLENFIEDNL